MNLNDFLLSKTTVVTLNILQCVLFALSLVFLSAGVGGSAALRSVVPFIAPAITLLFLLSKSPGPILAALGVIVNLLVAILGLVLLFLLRGTLTPLIVLVAGFSGMLIPSMSMLAIAVRWPRPAF